MKVRFDPEMVQILNHQNFRRLNMARLKKLAGLFLSQSAIAGKKKSAALSLLLTDDAGIRQINRQFFDRDCATDVISFTLNPRQQDEPSMGEIAINVERAIQEGKKRRGFEREFALYLAHGCDHLAGHNDRTVKERKKMRRRELAWLKQAARLKLL